MDNTLDADVAELLREMRNHGSWTDAERTTWLLRKQELLGMIEEQQAQ